MWRAGSRFGPRDSLVVEQQVRERQVTFPYWPDDAGLDIMPTFIGIDLAWKSDGKHTGAAVLERDRNTVRLCEEPSGLQTLDEVEAFIERPAAPGMVVAIDAPLVISNYTGERSCETEIGRRFGVAHASAHSSTLKLYPNPRCVQRARNLEANRFVHCPQPHSAAMNGKWFFEVYPHPAHVILFGRQTIIKCKKGREMLVGKESRTFVST